MSNAINWNAVLQKLAPKALPVASAAFPSLPQLFEDFKLNTVLEQVYYVALTLEETGGFETLDENLHYTSAELLKLFPKYFTPTQAKTYAGNQEAIANRIYANRMGNTSPGDGWAFHGRGPFQLTGRAEYAAVGKLAQLPLAVQPELVNATRYMFVIGAHYWVMRGLSPSALADNIEEFTRLVNGGEIGLQSRIAWLNKTKEAVGA